MLWVSARISINNISCHLVASFMSERNLLQIQGTVGPWPRYVSYECHSSYEWNPLKTNLTIWNNVQPFHCLINCG